MPVAFEHLEEEQRSYGAVFLLGVGLLLAATVWAVWDDNIIRRPWKKYQSQFFALEVQRAREALAAEDARLAADAGHQELSRQLAAARAKAESGETAARLAELDERAHAARLVVQERDLNLRIVKSRLEEAWYEYEHAVLSKAPTGPARAHLDELEEERRRDEAALSEAEAALRQIENEIAETRSAVKDLETKLREMTAARERLAQRLDGLVLRLAGFELPRIPRIEQSVLGEFDRNNFDQPVARVDRCRSCHAGIDKAGFENDPNPFKTHPRRDPLLVRHPPDRFGCTPCHGGQGPAVNSVAKAHGEVKFWEHPLRHGEGAQSSCIQCHVDVRVPGAERIAEGEKLFVNLGCHGCHLVQGYGELERVGPYLRRAAAKLEPGWLVRWVANPHAFRPQTKMPNFLFERRQAVAVAAYLLDASRADSETWLNAHPLPAGVDPDDAAKVEAGRALADSLGCRGCHGFAGDDSPARLGTDKDVAPNLSRVAEKADARWIYHWLKNPRGYSPVSRMPSLRLSDAEAAALTSYLLTLGKPEPADAALLATLRDPTVVAEGKALVRKYGCSGCHDIPGMEGETRIGVELSSFGSKTLDELFFGNRTDIPVTWRDWTYHKIKTPRTYQTERIEQLMPQFDLADSDIAALILFLQSRSAEAVPEGYRPADLERERALYRGRLVVEKYNCVGCHVIENQGGVIRARYEDAPTLAPPILNGEGKKVQPDWLYEFLKQPLPLRPWLKVRMPTFGLSDEETDALVDYFLALDRVAIPFVHVDEASIPAEHVAAGQTLASVDYFNCFSCHQQGDKKPEGPEEGWAPDLALARRRLSPPWIIEWLRDPQKLQPGTKMPSFYPGGPEDVFDGNEDRQIEALRDYIMSLGGGGPKVMAEANTRGGATSN
jgi:mono/diheme cytochrome c family protein